MPVSITKYHKTRLSFSPSHSIWTENVRLIPVYDKTGIDHFCWRCAQRRQTRRLNIFESAHRHIAIARTVFLCVFCPAQSAWANWKVRDRQRRLDREKSKSKQAKAEPRPGTFYISCLFYFFFSYRIQVHFLLLWKTPKLFLLLLFIGGINQKTSEDRLFSICAWNTKRKKRLYDKKNHGTNGGIEELLEFVAHERSEGARAAARNERGGEGVWLDPGAVRRGNAQDGGRDESAQIGYTGRYGYAVFFLEEIEVDN